MRRIAIPTLLLLSGLLTMTSVFAGGAKKPPIVEPAPSDGKRVVSVAPVENVRIELPDGKFYDFGQDFQARLTTTLVRSGKFIVVDPEEPASQTQALSSEVPGFVWPGSSVTGAALRIEAEALSFVTGERGGRTFYGFDPRFRNEFNHGRDGQLPNEFPLRTGPQPSWFVGPTFDEVGGAPFSSRAGLDLGEGLSIDALFAWLSVKYARYEARMKLRIHVDSEVHGIHETRDVNVRGRGYYFDVVGAYQGYSGGIMLARRDAMLQAFHQAIDGTSGAIERALADVPLTARVDAIVTKNRRTYLLLGTGRDADVRSGVLYRGLEDPSLGVRVLESVSSGAIGELVRGDIRDVRAGMVLRQIGDWNEDDSQGSVIMASRLTAFEEIELPEARLESLDFAEDEAPKIDRAAALARSIIEGVFLGYRVWRYLMYDRERDARPDGNHYSETRPELSGRQKWASYLRSRSWATRIGLTNHPVPELQELSGGPLVAVIDTGVDYNHPVLHAGSSSGWDFYSHDPRGHDDAYHGTRIAGAVIGVAPNTRILPVKAFNPWGVTSSAALLQAFRFAVDQGAQFILCAWATRYPADALRMGIEYARDRGVVVVTAAGDSGGKRLERNPHFPASFAREYSNVLVVTAVDEQDRILADGRTGANIGSETVHLAAPGGGIAVLEPRSNSSHASGTDIAAGIVAGALALHLESNPGISPGEAVQEVIQASESLAGLMGSVRDGKRLRIPSRND